MRRSRRPGPAEHRAACVPKVAAVHVASRDVFDTIEVSGNRATLVSPRAVTFRSQRDARQFAAALTEAPLRVGRVRFMCAD